MSLTEQFLAFQNESSREATKDVFKEVFSNEFLNWSLFVLYLLGLISCGLLIIVSWFEKTGQAGPFRTLANQLVSHQLDQVSHFLLHA